MGMDYRLTMYQQMFSLIGQQVRHFYRVVVVIQAPWLEKAVGWEGRQPMCDAICLKMFGRLINTE
jgi:hypothetical protein